MIDSESHVSVGETGTNGTVKVGFLLTHLNTWNHPAGFLSHDVLAGEVMSHSVPERNLIVALIKGEKKAKTDFYNVACGPRGKPQQYQIPRIF